MKLVYESAPQTVWHSFVLTEENGAKLYGVCLIMHNRLSKESHSKLKEMSAGWKFDTSKLVGPPSIAPLTIMWPAF